VRKRRHAKVLILIVTSLTCLVILELALRKLAWVQDPYADLKYRQQLNQYIKSEHPKNLRLVTAPEADLPGMKGPSVFTTNNLGFRGDPLVVPKPADEFRIFMVGGSTTECLYLDDSKTLTRVLQDELNGRLGADVNVRVYGAAKSGDATDDHVAMITQRLVQLQPDMIIVFAGVNDLTRTINNYDYLHYVDAPPQRVPLLKSMATEFQIGRRFYYLFNRVSPNVTQVFQEIHLTSDFREKARACNNLPISKDKPRVDAVSFANNLKTIAGVTMAHGIKLAFLTQQTTWNGPDEARRKEWQWITCRSGVKYREDFMDEAMNVLNNETRRVAGLYKIPLYDLAASIPKSREFFFDDVHFNHEGARFTAHALATLIVANQQLARNGSP